MKPHEDSGNFLIFKMSVYSSEMLSNLPRITELESKEQSFESQFIHYINVLIGIFSHSPLHLTTSIMFSYICYHFYIFSAKEKNENVPIHQNKMYLDIFKQE